MKDLFHFIYSKILEAFGLVGVCYIDTISGPSTEDGEFSRQIGAYGIHPRALRVFQYAEFPHCVVICAMTTKVNTLKIESIDTRMKMRAALKNNQEYLDCYESVSKAITK